MNRITGEIKLTPYQSIMHNLDQIPIPRWNLVQLKQYQCYGRIGSINSFGDEKLPTYIMQTVRGCLGACTFCSVRNFYGKGVRSYSAQRVLNEIDYLYNELGITQLEILDDDFTYDNKRTIEICDGLIERKYDLVWNILNGIRLGTITEEVMDKLAKAGCRLISVGIESGNDSTLRTVRKPLSMKMLYEKMKIIKKYPEIYVKGNFIVGFPFESEIEMRNTYRVAEEIELDWNIFSVFTPLPGTPLFQKLQDEQQSEFNFDSVKNDFQFDLATNTTSHAPYSKKSEVEIAALSYTKNLELNFVKNKNLGGKNIRRAIRDFKGIVKFIAKDHAIAHYCLAKAYRDTNDYQLSNEHLNKTLEILNTPMIGKKWQNYFNILVNKEEYEDLKKIKAGTKT